MGVAWGGEGGGAESDHVQRNGDAVVEFLLLHVQKFTNEVWQWIANPLDDRRDRTLLLTSEIVGTPNIHCGFVGRIYTLTSNVDGISLCMPQNQDISNPGNL